MSESRQTTPPQSGSSLLAKPKNTPMSKKLSGSATNSSTTLTRDQRFEAMWSEIHRYVVGPMPANDFLQRFLRSEISSVQYKAPKISIEGLKAYVGAANKDRYKLFVDALQPICSKLEFRDTHDTPMKTFQQFTVRPDVCVVDRDVGLAKMTNAEICIELKPDNNDDPFDDKGEEKIMKDNEEPEKFFVKKTKAGPNTFGQSTLYATVHQAAQFRTHVFSVLVFPNHARLMRWDRSGVIVTEKLSIFSPLFVEFFHLYEHATPSKRGIDISVIPAPPPHISNARASLATASLASASSSASLATDPTVPLVQLSLGSNESYIVCRAAYMNLTHSPLGRSTRTFIAYSPSRHCNVFLKDSWRLASQTPEHEIYEQLRLKDVQHIPTVIEGADILDHTTLTQDIVGEKPEWIRVPPSKPLRKHCHYRLVLEDIATPLYSFPSTKVLVTAIRDAIIAHQDAYFKAGILHRDISSGNIMIHKDGGLLIDWDLSKSAQEEEARETERTGTWQFISARLLEDPNAVQNLTDDVESFVHVITWVSFRYAKHNMTDEALEDFLTSVFDHAYYEKDGTARGGNAKFKHLNTPVELSKTIFESPNLKQLIQKITKIISVRYKEAPSSDSEDDSDDAAESDYRRHERIRHARKHARKQAKLETSTWIISEFASALSKPGWPDEDKAIKHGIIQAPSTKDQSSASKRKSSESHAIGTDKKFRTLRSGGSGKL